MQHDVCALQAAAICAHVAHGDCVTALQLLQKRAQGLLSCAMEGLGSATADNVSVFFLLLLFGIVFQSNLIAMASNFLSLQAVPFRDSISRLMKVTFCTTSQHVKLCMHSTSFATRCAALLVIIYLHTFYNTLLFSFPPASSRSSPNARHHTTLQSCVHPRLQSSMSLAASVGV
jgi:hypothetical protein